MVNTSRSLPFTSGLVLDQSFLATRSTSEIRRMATSTLNVKEVQVKDLASVQKTQAIQNTMVNRRRSSLSTVGLTGQRQAQYEINIS